MAKFVNPNWRNLRRLIGLASESAVVYTPFYSRRGLQNVAGSLATGISLEFCTKLKLLDWSRGVSNPERLATVLTELSEGGHSVALYVHQQLHAKAYFADRKFGLLGSANLTDRGFGANVEALLLLRGSEADQALSKLERRFRAGAKQIDLEQLTTWVRRFHGQVIRVRKRGRQLKQHLLDVQLDADNSLGLPSVSTVIPSPTREMCDRFADWLEQHDNLAGAAELHRHATDTVKLRRQGHFRKCFGAVYRFIHEYPSWQPVLAGTLQGMGADAYFQPSPELLADWRRHVLSHSSLNVNEVCNYETLQNILPTSYGGSVAKGGGGVSTLRRMFPLVAYYLESGMV